jgi:hypothetical protein
MDVEPSWQWPSPSQWCPADRHHRNHGGDAETDASTVRTSARVAPNRLQGQSDSFVQHHAACLLTVSLSSLPSTKRTMRRAK